MTALTAQEGTDAGHPITIDEAQTSKTCHCSEAKATHVKKDKSHLDEEAHLEAEIKSWKSSVYAHYDAPMIVKKEEVEGSEKKEVIYYRFTCKVFKDHEVDRKRDGFASGAALTSQLLAGVQACEAKHAKSSERSTTLNEFGYAFGDKSDEKKDSGDGKKSGIPCFPYSPQRFRFWLALLCARRKRPFNIVEDYELHVIFKMLRPDVHLVSGDQVSKDLWNIYTRAAQIIKDVYLKVEVSPHFASHFPIVVG
ncbi:hypothetical protein BT69DRAFT_1337540 [Atractiella rhizophila]|nr:hypothetical protein BT69DRAFT_1337540 [Atractiella rhizophila]